MESNPYQERLDSFIAEALKCHKLDAFILFNEFNIRALTGVACDSAVLVLKFNKGKVVTHDLTFYTDFRYIPMVHRTAPWLKVETLWKSGEAKKALKKLFSKVEERRSVRDCRIAEVPRNDEPLRIGFEFNTTAARFMDLCDVAEAVGAELVELDAAIEHSRSVKTVSEIMKIAEAEALNDQIWELAQEDIHPGMTEKDIQRVIRAYMNALGDGEAFETIVCAGANAAECHHVPDETVWQEGEGLLVDMGVKLNGFCSDMTRNIRPSSRGVASREYNKIYKIVLAANKAAIAAAKPGMTCGELDEVARKVIRDAGYEKAFGHSLGHGVGFEIHEAPTASPKNKTVLEPGMIVTIEPGIYLEGKLGIRIEDLVLITSTGCEVLSHSVK